MILLKRPGKTIAVTIITGYEAGSCGARSGRSLTRSSKLFSGCAWWSEWRWRRNVTAFVRAWLAFQEWWGWTRSVGEERVRP